MTCLVRPKKGGGILIDRLGDKPPRRVPEGAIVLELDPALDRTFRDAWTLENGAVVVDMPKARDIWRANLRQMRKPLLAELDTEYQRADEDGDVARKRAVAAKKQALRDITKRPEIDAAQTPDDLLKIGVAQ